MKRTKKKLTRKEKEDRSAVLWWLFFEKLLEKVEAFIMVTDSSGRIVFANSSCLDSFSLPEKAVMGKDWIKSIIAESERNAISKIFSDIKRKKMLMRFDAPVMIAKRLEKRICWSAIPLKERRRYFYMFIGRERTCSAKRVNVHNVTPLKLNEAYREAIDMFFKASISNDPDTAKHAHRVMAFAVALAKRLKISKKRIERLKVACLLHDIGKIAVDEKILYKKGKLTRKEFAQIKRHPIWGADVAKLFYFLRDIIPIMMSHHENYNGSGYPAGLKGDAIPLEARLLSVVDIYEALTADRPYRKGFSREEAIAIIREERGWKLDPKITDIFLEMVKKNKIKEENIG